MLSRKEQLIDVVNQWEIVGVKMFTQFGGVNVHTIFSVMQTIELRVGMSCEGCVGAVKRVLSKMEGSLTFFY